MNVSPPAVTAAIKRLRRDGLICVGEEGEITLTDAGQAIAGRVLNRHHLIERMLTELFGMEWYKVHDEAEQLEHAVSAEFERLLVERLGPDGPCPHGNYAGLDSPAERRKRGWKQMFELSGGVAGQVICVYERDRNLLEYLNGLGIKPGSAFKVAARNYDDTLSLDVNGRPVQLGRMAAEQIWVSEESKA